MPITLTLLAALTAGNWHCEQSNGLWECRAPSATISAAPETTSQFAERPGPAPDAAREPVTESAPSPVPEPAPTADAEPTPEPSAQPDSASAPLPETGDKSYVVQVGAFRAEESARQQAERIADRHLEIMPTRHDGEDWYVLLLGAYPSWEEADAAGRAYEESSGGSYWVRNASDLQRILRPD